MELNLLTVSFRACSFVLLCCVGFRSTNFLVSTDSVKEDMV